MKFLRKIGKKNKGFTLIELIVVIAILAILAAVIVPRIVGFISDAESSADKANARLLHNAAVLALSHGDISIPASTTSYTAIDDLAGIEKYLDEWPMGSDDAPLVLIIDDAGKCEVTDSDGDHLAGATISS